MMIFDFGASTTFQTIYHDAASHFEAARLRRTATLYATIFFTYLLRQWPRLRPYSPRYGR